MYKVYCSYGYINYADPLLQDSRGLFTLTDKLDDADIVLFAGGEDVNPELYNQKKHRTTQFNDWRDIEEMSDYNYAKETGKFMVGICRGMQFLSVMNGCSLFQHVGNHCNYHDMVTVSGCIPVNSTHHQMVDITTIPKAGGVLLGWAENQATYIYDGDNVDHQELEHPAPEPEAVYFPKTKVFAVQYHPEWLSRDHAGRKWFVDHVIDLVKGTL